MTSKEKIVVVSIALALLLLSYALKLSWVIPTLIILLLLILTLFIEFERSYASTRLIAVLGFITAVTIVSRQMVHGFAVSPVFFFVILTGYVFGAVSGFVVGATTMFVSNFFVGGHGPWTPFQMIALGSIGFCASILPKKFGIKTRILLLSFFGVIASFFYSAVTDVFWWMTFTTQHTLKTYLAVSVAGVPFSIATAFGNILMMVFFSPTFIKILERFRKRFFMEYVD